MRRKASKKKPKPTMIERIDRLMRSHVFRYRDEADFQEGIAIVLRGAGIRFEREVKLGTAGRIDFMVRDTIGLEVKVTGSNSLVIRQIQRYANRPEVSEIILVTTRAVHMNIPDRLRGKRVTVICLWEGAL